MSAASFTRTRCRLSGLEARGAGRRSPDKRGRGALRCSCGLPGCRSQLMLCGTLADDAHEGHAVWRRTPPDSANMQSPALEIVGQQNPAVSSRQRPGGGLRCAGSWRGPARNRLEACQFRSTEPESLCPARQAGRVQQNPVLTPSHPEIARTVGAMPFLSQ